MPPPDPHVALLQHFGFSAFRPGQEEAVRAALAGRDALVVMPTGAGKSLCYQLPALMREDLTVVVSPLVSLMADQVQALARRAPGRVALVNGQQEPGENAAALEAALSGEVRVLYVAPERFSAPGFARALKPARVGLFVVDEAHCVSQWGHDFRPDYFRLADAARWLGAAAIMASTATATPSVAADIVTRLGLRAPVRVATGFDRPNLSWAVVPSSTRTREAQLVAALAEPGSTPAIVYAGTRRQVDALAEALSTGLDRPVLAYHAGLERGARAEAQRRFMAGEVDVVVATNAFGMGIDKADVRTVVHAGVPGSVEAYYQEAGRAGRDGRPARAVLLAAAKDKGLHVFFIQRAEVTPEEVERIALRLQELAGGAPEPGVVGPIYDVALTELGGEADRIRAVVGALARAGVLLLAPAPVDRVRGRLLRAYDRRAHALCRTLVTDAQRGRWRQYRAVWGLVEGTRCRRATILAHFGDDPPAAGGTGCCDVCDPKLVPAVLRLATAGRSATAPTARAVRAAEGVPAATGAPASLPAAIEALVATAEPPLSRARLVEVLRGDRSAAVVRHRYDGLPAYGTCGQLSARQLLTAVDAALADGRLELTGGVFPTLRVVGASADERLAA